MKSKRLLRLLLKPDGKGYAKPVRQPLPLYLSCQAARYRLLQPGAEADMR